MLFFAERKCLVKAQRLILLKSQSILVQIVGQVWAFVNGEARYHYLLVALHLLDLEEDDWMVAVACFRLLSSYCYTRSEGHATRLAIFGVSKLGTVLSSLLATTAQMSQRASIGSSV